MSNHSDMLIHWFPGHMTKSLREIEASLRLADIVLYVLDARAPFSCINPAFDALVQHKPVIYVLNKADLAPEQAVTAWKARLSGADRSVVALSGTASGSAKKILPLIQKSASAKIEKYRAKGINAALRGMVIGVPNSGKSTLINNFCGNAKTVTGNKPGVTRGKQWVRVNEYFELLDTPGTLYPKLSDQTVARRLAYIGSVKDEVVDSFALACAFIEDVGQIAPDALKARYGTESGADVRLTLEQIAQSRGFLNRGGEPDTGRAAAAVLDDFRKGRLGKICLDSQV